MKKFLFAILSILILATTLAGQEISFNLTPEEEAEKASWIAKGLMYPKYGYDKVSWGAGVDEVKKHYTGMVNTSDEDSLFGMRKFSQTVGSGGIVKREFYFYQGGLIKVTVQYDKSVEIELIRDKIKSTYGKGEYPESARAGYYSPSANKIDKNYNIIGEGSFVENPKQHKDCYPLARYYHPLSPKTDEKIDVQRFQLKKHRADVNEKKQIDALGL